MSLRRRSDFLSHVRHRLQKGRILNLFDNTGYVFEAYLNCTISHHRQVMATATNGAVERSSRTILAVARHQNEVWRRDEYIFDGSQPLQERLPTSCTNAYVHVAYYATPAETIGQIASKGVTRILEDNLERETTDHQFRQTLDQAGTVCSDIVCADHLVLKQTRRPCKRVEAIAHISLDFLQIWYKLSKNNADGADNIGNKCASACTMYNHYSSRPDRQGFLEVANVKTHLPLLVDVNG